MKGCIWLLPTAALALVLALGGTSNVVNASLPDTLQEQTLGRGNTQQLGETKGVTDGLEQLPLGMQGTSYSTLVHSGQVKPFKLDVQADPNAKFQPSGGYYSPLVTWDQERNASGLLESNEPDATLHPSDSLYALVSGNYSLDNTTNGGLTWQNTYPPWPNYEVDIVQAFAPTSIGQNTAIATGLVNCTPGPCQLAAGRSIDRGVTWQNFSPSGMTTPDFFNDRPDLWSDNDPASPFYGRMYLTKTLFDPGRTGSYNTVTTQYSTNNGESWSGVFPHDNPSTYYTEGPKQFGSMGFGPNGTIYVAWFASRCCISYPPPINVPNKLRWARSTDGV